LNESQEGMFGEHRRKTRVSNRKKKQKQTDGLEKIIATIEEVREGAIAKNRETGGAGKWSKDGE